MTIRLNSNINWSDSIFLNLQGHGYGGLFLRTWFGKQGPLPPKKSSEI